MAETPVTQAWDFGRGRAGYVWRSPSPRAKLLLAHGYGEYAERYIEYYHRLIPHLVALGFDVHAFDLEGGGRRKSRDAKEKTVLREGGVVGCT